MNRSVEDIIRAHCHPMVAQPTTATEQLRTVSDVKAVMFDIYGTMLISGAGDITLQTEVSSDDALRTALEQFDFPTPLIAQSSSQLLQDTIKSHQEQQRQQGIQYPEVDIVNVWRDVVETIGGSDPSQSTWWQDADAPRLAAEYEVRVNPVWPMPDLLETLAELRRLDFQLGIISNAQAMTLELFPALLGQSLEELGFDPDLQFFSFQHGESKSGPTMFAAAAAALTSRGLKTDNTVFIGNDMLNDVWAADQHGFRTILFAGDARSLRLRTDDERVQQTTPDAVIKDLASITKCLVNSSL